MLEDHSQNDDGKKENIAQANVTKAEIGNAIAWIVSIVRCQSSRFEGRSGWNIDEDS
jgi:hypothetical protein